MNENSNTFEDGPFGLTKWQRRLALLLVFTVFGVLEATREHIVFNLGGGDYKWHWTLVWGLTDWYLWGLLSLIIIRITRVVGFERRLWPWNLLLHLVLAICFGMSQIFLDTVGYRLSIDLLFTGQVVEGSSLWQNYVYFLKTMGHTAIIIYFLIALGSYALTYFRQFRDAQVDRARVQTQLAEAHLESLKSRLHPHFLFNALNSISALLHTDVERADRMIARLSELLRASIENTGIKEVSLRDEIDFLDRYLEIQRVRFEDRFEVSYQTGDEVSNAAVPSLILQPLVENTIRHGVAKVIRPVSVMVSAHRENGNLVISVKDDGPGFEKPVADVKPGFGLRSTRERLEQMYGTNQSLDLQSSPGEGVGITIRLPFRRIDPGTDDKISFHDEIS